MSKVKKPQHGGARPGSGRPGLEPGEQSVVVSVRLTHAQRDKLAALGNAAWVRERLDRAKAP